jgi:hypothetical protein
MATILIESDDGELASASAVLQVRGTNADYNQPALRIDQASARGGAASIKIVDPNPDIEFVESDAADAGHVGFRTGSQFGAGQGVIAIGNAIVAPSVNPGGGGVLYVQGGALKYRGSNGTVTTIAPA